MVSLVTPSFIIDFYLQVRIGLQFTKKSTEEREKEEVAEQRRVMSENDR